MFSSVLSTVLMIVVLGFLAVLLAYFGRQYVKFRGKRVVTCPATHSPAAVEVDALHAAISAPTHPELRLSACTHWPERSGCGQECLREIESAPEGCLVQNILADWYAGKTCVTCGKQFGKIDWLEHKPGLLAPDKSTCAWNEIEPEKLHATLESHSPVCWDCHNAVRFRHMYPDLVTDRPWRR